MFALAVKMGLLDDTDQPIRLPVIHAVTRIGDEDRYVVVMERLETADSLRGTQDGSREDFLARVRHPVSRSAANTILGGLADYWDGYGDLHNGNWGIGKDDALVMFDPIGYAVFTVLGTGTDLTLQLPEDCTWDAEYD